jgi:hypothetical protein
VDLLAACIAQRVVGDVLIVPEEMSQILLAN